jgi:hypothetical protein
MQFHLINAIEYASDDRHLVPQGIKAFTVAYSISCLAGKSKLNNTGSKPMLSKRTISKGTMICWN